VGCSGLRAGSKRFFQKTGPWAGICKSPIQYYRKGLLMRKRSTGLLSQQLWAVYKKGDVVVTEEREVRYWEGRGTTPEEGGITVDIWICINTKSSAATLGGENIGPLEKTAKTS